MEELPAENEDNKNEESPASDEVAEKDQYYKPGLISGPCLPCTIWKEYFD